MTEQVIGGSLNIFGPRAAEKKKPLIVPDKLEKELVIPLNYDDLATYSSNDATVQSIPANSLILSCELYVETAFAGGTSYAVGLYQSDSTVIDADGLITDLNAPLANINAAGDWVVGSGALVGATIGTAAGQVVVAATGTFTAGKAFIRVKYLEPMNFG